MIYSLYDQTISRQQYNGEFLLPPRGIWMFCSPEVSITQNNTTATSWSLSWLFNVHVCILIIYL